MKFARCFLKGSDNPLRWVDVPLPDGPQMFINFITTVRINGAVYPSPAMQVFIPFDEIKLALEIEAGAPTLGGIIHEAPETKQ
jgi:hypothetical protein